MFSRKSDNGTVEYGRILEQTRRGFTSSVNRYIQSYLDHVINVTDQLTVTKSGLEQVGVTSLRIELTKYRGTRTAGAWTGQSIAKKLFPNAKHGIVDAEPKKDLPESCALNAWLAPFYTGPNQSKKQGTHYSVVGGRLQVKDKFWKTDAMPHLNGLDVSMLVSGTCGEQELNTFEEKNPNVSVSVWLCDNLTNERPILQRPIERPHALLHSAILLTNAIDKDGSVQEQSHFVGCKNGVDCLFRRKENSGFACEGCGHEWSNETARDNCSHGEPNATRVFPEPLEGETEAYARVSGNAMADMNSIVVVLDFEAHGQPQRLCSVGMTAYKHDIDPLNKNGLKMLSMIDPTKTVRKPLTVMSETPGEVIRETMKHLIHFCRAVEKERYQHTKSLRDNMTAEQWAKFHEDVEALNGVCPGCHKECSKFVPDHGHEELTGEWVYREPLCQPCNNKKRITPDIIILIHNGGGYDWIRMQDELSRELENCYCDCSTCFRCDCLFDCDCKPEKWRWCFDGVLASNPQNWISFKMHCKKPIEVLQCTKICRGGQRCKKAVSFGKKACCDHEGKEGDHDRSKAKVTKQVRATKVGLKFLDTLKFTTSPNVSFLRACIDGGASKAMFHSQMILLSNSEKHYPWSPPPTRTTSSLS